MGSWRWTQEHCWNHKILSGASTLILSEACQKLISLSDWDGELLTGSSLILVTSGSAFWLISDTYYQHHLDDLPSQHRLPRMGEHQTSIITHCVCLTLFTSDSEVYSALSVVWFPTWWQKLFGGWSPPPHPLKQYPPVHSCNAATQQLCQTECRHGRALTC